MKKLLKATAALMLAGILTGCGAENEVSPAAPAVQSDGGAVLYAVTAGSADALLLSCGGQTALIDAGYSRSMGAVRFGMEQLGAGSLDYVILTHTDTDHADGLEWLAQSDIAVGQWCTSALYTGVKQSKHPMYRAAEQRGEKVRLLAAGDSLALGDGALKVLAPDSGGEPADDDDNNSLVIMFESPAGRMLLTGDMEDEEEAQLLKNGADLACDVLKAANHGDDDTGSAEFIRRTSPKLVVICDDSDEKEGTPDPALLRRLHSCGAQVFETQNTDGGVMVRLSGGIASAEYIRLPEPSEKLAITSVSADEDTVTLTNSGDDVSLDGWYLYSDRGGEMFVFPKGTVLRSGGTLVIGSNSSDADCGVIWNDSKVISKKKRDAVTLYSPCGYPASRRDNGIKE